MPSPTEIGNLVVRINGAGVRSEARSIKDHLKQVQDQAKSVRQAMLGIDFNAGRPNAQVQALEKQLASLTKQEKLAQAGLKDLGQGTDRFSQGMSKLQIGIALMGLREALKEPVAKMLGLSEATQKVIDRSAALAQAGFSIGAVWGVGAGLAFAGVGAIGGAIMQTIGQTQEWKKEVQELGVGFDNMAKVARLAGEAINFDKVIDNLHKLEEQQKAIAKDQEGVLGGIKSAMAEILAAAGGGTGQGLADHLTGVAASTANAAEQGREMASAIEGAGEEMVKLSDKAFKARSDIKEGLQKKSAAELKKELEEATEAVQSFDDKMFKASVVLKNLASGKKSVDELRDAFDQLEVVTGSAFDPLIDFTKSSDVTAAITGKLKQWTADAKGLFTDLTDASSKYKSAVSSAKDPFEELLKKLREARDLSAAKLDISAGITDLSERERATKLAEYEVQLQHDGVDLDKIARGTKQSKRQVLEKIVTEIENSNRKLREQKQIEDTLRGGEDKLTDLRGEVELIGLGVEERKRAAFFADQVAKATKDSKTPLGDNLAKISKQADDYQAMSHTLGAAGILGDMEDQVALAAEQLRLSGDLGVSAGAELQLLELQNTARGKGVELTQQELVKAKSLIEQLNVLKAQQAVKGQIAALDSQIVLAELKLGGASEQVAGQTDVQVKKQEILNTLLEQGFEINSKDADVIEKKAKQLADLEKKLNDPFRKFAEQNKDLAQTTKEAFIGAIDGVNQSLLDFFKTGELSLDSFVNSFLDSMATVTLKFLEAKALAALLPGAPGGAGAAGVVQGVSSIFQGGQALGFHSGGVVGRNGTPTGIPGFLLSGAPRMHAGGFAGLRSDEVPAVLQRGETVLPRGAAAGPAWNVSIDMRGGTPNGRHAERRAARRIVRDGQRMSQRGLRR